MEGSRCDLFKLRSHHFLERTGVKIWNSSIRITGLLTKHQWFSGFGKTDNQSFFPTVTHGVFAGTWNITYSIQGLHLCRVAYRNSKRTRSQVHECAMSIAHLYSYHIFRLTASAYLFHWEFLFSLYWYHRFTDILSKCFSEFFVVIYFVIALSFLLFPVL